MLVCSLASYLCRNISDLLGLKWELRGGSYLSKNEPYVIVANHQSSIDILGIFIFTYFYIVHFLYFY